MRPTVVVSSRTGRFGSIALAVLGLLLLLLELVTGGPWAALRALPWLGLVVLVGFLLWGSGRLVLADELVLDNPFRRVHLPWWGVDQASARWGLEVRAQGRVWKAWAAPARGGLRTTHGPRAAQATPVPDYRTATPVVLRLDLPAAAAARLVEEQAAARATDARTGETGVQVRWERLVLLLVLLAGCAATILL
ncbi:hypothetical protein [Luteococcus peritonei]|uniref:PH domain-containing protein n=1 Tax=Luteococcus peritonei TaxID=88874 RepID=A0ABW4RRL1_9ACTN